MIFVGIGSNLRSSFGNRFDNIDLAVSFLNAYGVQVLKMSSYFETPSYPNKKNPKFINVVVSVKTNLNPVDLISVLIFIEEKLERKRNIKNDPRTCDIDIIDYNRKIINFNYNNINLELPHKRLSYRNFVLYPLQEVSPKWIHPITNETIGTLIKKLSADERKCILKTEKN